MKKAKTKHMAAYMDDSGLYYNIANKATNISNYSIFSNPDSYEALEYSKKLQVLSEEMKSLKKRTKVKDLSLTLTDGLRMVKVIEFENPIPLNKDSDLLIKEKVSSYLQPDENINNFEIQYLKTGKKEQRVFLVAMFEQKILNQTCLFCKENGIPLTEIKIPELYLYNYAKNLRGTTASILYDEIKEEIRLLITEGDKIIFSNQTPSVYKTSIEEEIKNIEGHIHSKYRKEIKEIILIGCSIEEESKYYEKLVNFNESEKTDKEIMISLS